MAGKEAGSRRKPGQGNKKKPSRVKEAFRHEVVLTERTRPECLGCAISVLKVLIFLSLVGILGGLWSIFYKNEHQVKYTGLPGTTSNVWGVAQATSKTSNGVTVYDAQDLVIPAEENSAFFVTTNPTITNNQQRGECAEHHSVVNSQCRGDGDCQLGRIYGDGHGIDTGKCNQIARTCIVQAWCPLEEKSGKNHDNNLVGVMDFKVLIKNYAYFSQFGISLGNARDLTATDLKTADLCTYHPDDMPLCPIFRLGDIVSEALRKNESQNFNESYDRIIEEGGVIAVQISWNCDFDGDPDNCLPEYSFDRLDTGERNNIQGYFVKHTHTYFDSRGVQNRQLITAYGILFVITVEANGFATDSLQIALVLGSSLGYFGFLSGVMICLLECCHQKRKTPDQKSEAIEMNSQA